MSRLMCNEFGQAYNWNDIETNSVPIMSFTFALYVNTIILDAKYSLQLYNAITKLLKPV